jgi:hypothetical protein
MKLQSEMRVAALILLGLMVPTASFTQTGQARPAAPARARTISGSGCVEAGVEAGCLVLKDSKTHDLYNLFFAGKPPAINTAIRFTGTAHQGPTTCMQGTPVNVKKFTVLRMHCPAPGRKK